MESKLSRSVEEVAREERLEYFRAWRAKNRDKIKKYNADYWRRRAAKKEACNNGKR